MPPIRKGGAIEGIIHMTNRKNLTSDNSIDYIGKRYTASDGYYAVIGYIDKPAILLKNPLTKKQMTVVIGCPNHLKMTEISDKDALEISEGHLLTSPKGV